MCIHDMVTTTNTRKPVLEKTKTKKDKAVLHHISAFKEKDRSGVSKRFIFLIFLIFFFFPLFGFQVFIWRSEIRYQDYCMAYLQYNKANEDMNCMSGTRPDGIAIFFYLFIFRWRKLWNMVGWCGVIFNFILDFRTFFVWLG